MGELFDTPPAPDMTDNRLSALEHRTVNLERGMRLRHRVELLEDALCDVDDRISALSVDLGIAFLLIAALGFLMSKSRG